MRVEVIDKNIHTGEVLGRACFDSVYYALLFIQALLGEVEKDIGFCNVEIRLEVGDKCGKGQS